LARFLTREYVARHRVEQQLFESSFLRAVPRRSRAALDFRQRIDARLADLAEVVFGCEREPRFDVLAERRRDGVRLEN